MGEMRLSDYEVAIGVVGQVPMIFIVVPPLEGGKDGYSQLFA